MTGRDTFLRAAALVDRLSTVVGVSPAFIRDNPWISSCNLLVGIFSVIVVLPWPVGPGVNGTTWPPSP